MTKSINNPSLQHQEIYFNIKSKLAQKLLFLRIHSHCIWTGMDWKMSWLYLSPEPRQGPTGTKQGSSAASAPRPAPRLSCSPMAESALCGYSTGCACLTGFVDSWAFKVQSSSFVCFWSVLESDNFAHHPAPCWQKCRRQPTQGSAPTAAPWSGCLTCLLAGKQKDSRGSTD